MANSLYPAFMRFQYQTAFSQHVLTVPLLNVDVDDADPNASEIVNHNSSQTNWITAATELLEAIADFFPDTTTFGTGILYTMTTPTSVPQPRAQNFFDVPGTIVAPGYTRAIQGTLVMRTAEFGLMKVVMLDIDSAGSLGKTTSLTGQPALQALVDILTDSTNGYVGRDGARPAVFVSFDRTENQKLDRAYRV